MQPVSVARCTPGAAVPGCIVVTLDGGCVVGVEALPIGLMPAAPNPTVTTTAAAPPNTAIAFLIGVLIRRSSLFRRVC
ncbi:hypothetical protein A5782_04355 [Mycobacterium sp. 852002-40037_SCH5390672]|nr:hypothetical protein A5782_04355 [Mycobacterium sp. 852002-40037_SCH5390672]